jgi:hypothetical protein
MAELKPALLSVRDAMRYLGGIPRTTLYVSLMPQLETVKIGKRRMISVASLDRLIAAARQEQLEADAKREEAKARYAKRHG